MKYVSLIFLLLCLTNARCQQFFSKKEVDSCYKQANQFYKTGQFKEAYTSFVFYKMMNARKLNLPKNKQFLEIIDSVISECKMKSAIRPTKAYKTEEVKFHNRKKPKS